MYPLICHILIGPPGCGKSTLACQWVKHMPNHAWIATDHIRKQLYGDAQIQGNWPTIEAEVLRQIKGAIAHQHPVIYDATNVRSDWRIDLLKKLDKEKAVWMGWVFHTPLAICKMRNQSRKHPVDDAVIEQFHQWLTECPPSTSEGFAAIHPVPITGSEFDFEIINRLIQTLQA